MGVAVETLEEGEQVGTFKRLGRAIRWGLVTGSMMGLGYFGYMDKLPWAWNLYRFMFWLTVVLTIFMMIAKDQQKMLRTRGRSVPAWIDIATDIAQIGFLAAVGYFWMAGFWTFHTGVYNAIMNMKEEKKDEA